MTDVATWTEERVELLKKLWNDGLSASQIAGEIGGVTRNAVIGKVQRLGLIGRAKSEPAYVVRPERQQRVAHVRQVTTQPKHLPASLGAAAVPPVPKPLLVEPPPVLGSPEWLLGKQWRDVYARGLVAAALTGEQLQWMLVATGFLREMGEIS